MDKLNYIQQCHSFNTAFLHGAGEAGTEALLRMFALKGGERILDFGCGTGGTLVKLKARFPSCIVSGMDLCPVARSQSIRRLEFVGLKKVIAIHDDFSSFVQDQFDVVYAESVLGIQELDGLQENLKRINQILRPNGRLLLNDSIWDAHVSELERSRINKSCLKNFGSVQCNFKDLNDAISKVEGSGFRFIGIQPLNEHRKSNYVVRGFKEKLSWFFSRWGAMKAFFLKPRDTWPQIMDPQNKYLQAYLIEFEKTNSS